MPAEVTVIATMKVKPGEEEQALEILRGVMAATHAEDGCVKYTLHRATNEPGAFSIVEKWRSQADLDAHFKEPHMEPVAEAMKLLTEPPHLLFCEPVGVGDSQKGTL